MANDTAADRIRKFINGKIKGKFTDAMIDAIQTGDELNQSNILQVKDQLFLATASEQFLDRLLAGIGVERPAGVGIDDDLIRDIAIKQTNSKIVSNIFLDILEVFYGEEATRANVNSGIEERYRLEDGMTLLVLEDTNPVQLQIVFNSDDFEDITRATADEVQDVISRAAYAQGYKLSAVTDTNFETKKTYVRLYSGTKGPKSSITVLGGRAQAVLKFPEARGGQPKVGTQFTTSFVGPFVRFTWTSGADPGIGFLNEGDIVNIYGAFLPENFGSFRVENVQGGTVGQAFFEITNPNFVAQGPVILTDVDGASGNGVASRTVLISDAPTGQVRLQNTVTITTVSPHGLSPGQVVLVSGVAENSMNGEFTVLTAGGSTFTHAQLGPDTSSGGGSVELDADIVLYPSGQSRASGLATITTQAAHGFTTGQTIEVSGVEDSSFNGSYTITVTSPTQFTYVQDSSNDMTFFYSKKTSLQTLSRYQTIYEVNPYELVVFLPATTKIVKRDLIGSWHLLADANDHSFQGSYLFSPSEGFSITKNQTALSTAINRGEFVTVAFGSDTSDFPDQESYIVLDFGTDNQEGPIRVLGRPSTGSLLIDPSYRFKKTHEVGADITLIHETKPYSPQTDGSDQQAYVTGTVIGRLESQKLIEKLVQSGIQLSIVIVYPDGPGLNDLEGTVYSGDPS